MGGRVRRDERGYGVISDRVETVPSYGSAQAEVDRPPTQIEEVNGRVNHLIDLLEFSIDRITGFHDRLSGQAGKNSSAPQTVAQRTTSGGLPATMERLQMATEYALVLRDKVVMLDVVA